MLTMRMRILRNFWIPVLTVTSLLCAGNPLQGHAQATPTSIEGRHLANIRQLTVGGNTARASFSFDGDKLIFQSTRATVENVLILCYHLVTMNLDGTHVHTITPGYGTATHGYFFPSGRRILYSSTHRRHLDCTPLPKQADRHQWFLNDDDIYSVRLDGREMQRLTRAPGYDAEATISPNGKSIVFTSVRNGDIDLYTMDIDGRQLKQLTHKVGYDGEASFSPDNRRIVYRAFHPQDLQEIDRYRERLAQHVVEPSRMEIFVMKADGTEKTQVTANGALNLAPCFHPDSRRIIFSSNVESQTFHLYLVNDDGTGMEQITVDGHVNSFPVFSPDGTQLVWTSDRHATRPQEVNVFLADWVP